MSQCKAAEARAEILQRTIALVFRDVMLSSHVGMGMTLPDGLVMNINPRLILYVSDQPEERDDVCLKRHGSAYDCTPCMARSTSCGDRPTGSNKAALQMVLTERIESLVRRSRQVSRTSAKKAGTVRRVLARGVVSSVSKFAATSALVALDEALHCSTSDNIKTQSGALLPGAGDHRARGERTVLWATRDLGGCPWYD